MQEEEQDQSYNTYIMDAESPVELARLLSQDRLTTRDIGHLVPDGVPLASAKTILDIACGPGGWALDVAFCFPQARVVGIDISQRMVDYANAQALANRLDNADFRVMDALDPLDFADSSFDVINGRFWVAFMPTHKWPALLAECKRILRPGGWLILNESDLGMTNSAAMDQLCVWIGQSLKILGFSFSPAGRTVGVVGVLPFLLQQAGFENVQKQASIMDASYGQEQHNGWIEDIQLVLTQLYPLLVGRNLASKEHIEQTRMQLTQEINDPGFCNIGFMLTAYGKKPLSYQ